MKIVDQLINFMIRPPRSKYNPDKYLLGKDFSLEGKKYKRHDLELTNGHGHILQCSHYVPSLFPQDHVPLPCVIYCHGNSGCRADANEAAVLLLPSNITVFTLDFSGSGLSDGVYVSLGWHEKEDLKVVISYLRDNEQISCIGLWGRSMGAVTSLLYGAEEEDPSSIAGMVLDSPFSNLVDLMVELVDVYKIRLLPKFTVKIGIQYMRRVIKKKAKFDIMDLNCVKVAPRTYIPALFGHASDDRFVQPHHSDLIYNSYAAADKNIIKFDGDHNSSRPQFYNDSVSIFFYNVLHPPAPPQVVSSVVDEYNYDLASLKIGASMEDKRVLYWTITGLRYPTSSSSAGHSVLNSKLHEYFYGIAAVTKVADDSSLTEEIALEGYELLEMQDNMQSHLNEECCSYTSSIRVSWGTCSSLGIGASDDESSVDFAIDISNHQVLATDLPNEGKKRKKASKILKILKHEKCERLEAFSHGLRIFFQKQVSLRLQIFFQKQVNRRRRCFMTGNVL